MVKSPGKFSHQAVCHSRWCAGDELVHVVQLLQPVLQAVDEGQALLLAVEDGRRRRGSWNGEKETAIVVKGFSILLLTLRRSRRASAVGTVSAACRWSHWNKQGFFCTVHLLCFDFCFGKRELTLRCPACR